MSESSKPNPTNGRQNNPTDCSTSSTVAHRCPAPSPSPGLATHSTTTGTPSAPMAPPSGIPSGPGQPAQSAAPLTRPGPLFTAKRQPKPKHITFKTVKIHTAKCDVCNHHNTATLSRCIDCGWQICTPCLSERSGDTNHIGIAAGIYRAAVNPAPARVNPSSNAPGPAPTASINPTPTRVNPSSNVPTGTGTTPTASVNPPPSGIQGPAPNAPGSGGQVSSAVTTIAGIPTTINTSRAPIRTAPNIPLWSTPVGPAPLNKEQNPENNLEGKKGERSALAEDNEVWKKWELRPRGVVNYYPEAVVLEEETDKDKEVAVDDDTDDESSDSDGGDIPFDAWKRAPSGPKRSDAPRSMAQTSFQTADRPLQTQPSFGSNNGSEVTRRVDDLLYTAAEALIDLGVERVLGGNRAEGSNAATPSIPRATMQTPVSNAQQTPAQPPTAPYASTLKRKREAPSAQLKPTKTQGHAIRTGHTKLEVYTDPRDQASTSRAEPEARMDIDEEISGEAPTATGSGSATKAATRLQNLHRDALRNKDRNGKLKRVDRHEPKA